MDLRQAGINLEEIRSGKKTAIAGALNLLENRKPDASGLAAELIEALTRIARPRRHVIGITGPPGAGKSTLIAHLIREYRYGQREIRRPPCKENLRGNRARHFLLRGDLSGQHQCQAPGSGARATLLRPLLPTLP
jgi:hypothetical protein